MMTSTRSRQGAREKRCLASALSSGARSPKATKDEAKSGRGAVRVQKSSAKHTTPKKGPTGFPAILLAPGFFYTPRAHVLLPRREKMIRKIDEKKTEMSK